MKNEDTNTSKAIVRWTYEDGSTSGEGTALPRAIAEDLLAEYSRRYPKRWYKLIAVEDERPG